jgi:ubiquinone biosynthesis protein
MRPIINILYINRYSPQRIGRDLLRGARALSTSATSLPGQIHDILDDMRAGRVSVQARDPDLARATERLGRRVFTAAIASTLLAAATALLCFDRHPTLAILMMISSAMLVGAHLARNFRNKSKSR